MGMGEALMVAAGGRWGPAPCGRAGMVLPSQPASRLAHRRADLKRQPTRFRLRFQQNQTTHIKTSP